MQQQVIQVKPEAKLLMTGPSVVPSDNVEYDSDIQQSGFPDVSKKYKCWKTHYTRVRF